MTQLVELAIIVVGHQVALRAAKIPKKTIGDVGAANNSAREGEHVFGNVVAVLFLKISSRPAVQFCIPTS